MFANSFQNLPLSIIQGVDLYWGGFQFYILHSIRRRRIFEYFLALDLTKSHIWMFSLSGVSLVLTDELEVDIEDLPLKFEDIVDKKTYDKMRPPKPGG